MSRKFLALVGTFALAGLGWFGLTGMTPQSVAPAPAQDGQHGLVIPELLDFQVFTPELPDTGDERVAASVRVRLGEQDYTLELAPYRMRGDGFRLLVQDKDGKIRAADAPPAATVRGHVAEVEGSRVAGSLHDGLLDVVIHMPDGAVWAVQPASEYLPNLPAGLHISYRQADFVPTNPGVCGVVDAPRTDAGELPVEGGIAGGTIRIVDIACDADREFYVLNASNPVTTMFDIESVLNVTEAIYERDCDITFEITTIVVRTAEPDPYTSFVADNMLVEMQSEWNTNLQSIRRDIAELFTGKDMSGNTLGIAWQAVVCDSITNGNGYSVVQSRSSANMTIRACLSAHEIGHNWSASHCDASPPCSIMCSGLGGCNGNCSVFTAQSIAEIVNHRNSRSCLSNLPAASTLPFSDSFPALSFDSTKWIYNDGAGISSAGVGEPSGTLSALLNAVNSGTYSDDDLRTNFMLLQGVTGANVSYWVEHRSVENGEQLVVEYWGTNLRWNELNRITSDGVDQSVYTQFTHAVPSNGRHNEFRLRFRPEVSDATDAWYIDDVFVGTTAEALTVSSVGASNVLILVSPNDNNGNGNGTTPFVRSYNPGTSVTLDAPETVPGADFERWTVNATNYPLGQRIITFAVNDTTSAVANYFPQTTYAVNVESAPNAGYLIGVVPPDMNLAGDGTTNFTRVYVGGIPVVFTAPLTRAVGSFTYAFCYWQVNGVPQTAGDNSLDWVANGNDTVTATYALRGDMNGDDAVNNADIDGFVLGLTDPAGYETAFPGLDRVKRGDCNGDGQYDNADIDAFVGLLL